MTATFDDQEWMLRALRGDIQSEAAFEFVATVRAFPNPPEELAQALADGDAAHPGDERRFVVVELGPPKVDEDQATVAAWHQCHPEGVSPDTGWGDPDDVIGELVLDDVAMFLGRFVSFPSAAAHTAVALWVAHAHMVGAFDSTPRLALLSPEPGSGKTRVLEVVELLVPNPLHVLNANTAPMFRMIQQSRPVLLFDEVDAIFKRGKGDDASEDLRALLNAGHRNGATIPRCVGPKHEVQLFAVYAAVALAGLGDLPDTLMSRSVVVRMRRRAPHERVESFRRRLVLDGANHLRGRLAHWANLVREDCGNAWPVMPEGVTDRPADVWEPLLAVADAAGGVWPKLAREACVTLVNAAASPEDQTLGVRLLADIRTVFGTSDRLTTADLLGRLHALDESPWSDLHGRPITARWLAHRVRPYGATSRDHRFPEGTRKGYLASDFHDAWSRYLTMGNKGNKGNSPASGVAHVADVADGRPETDPTAEGHAA